MRRLSKVFFVWSIMFWGGVTVAEPSVVFLSALPKGCKAVGQVVGVIDEGIYDKWSWNLPGYAEFSPAFMQEMKKQAVKIGANRIVFDTLHVEYLQRSSARTGTSYTVKNGTYTAKGYRCR